MVDKACQIGGIRREVERLYRRHYLLYRCNGRSTKALFIIAL